MPFFGENYILRRFGESKLINGYPVIEHEDITVFLDVQESFHHKKTEEAGSRDDMTLTTFGDVPIRCSKQEQGVLSDQLLYKGRWFECTSSILNKNTILKHWMSTFSLVNESKAAEPKIESETIK